MSAKTLEELFEEQQKKKKKELEKMPKQKVVKTLDELVEEKGLEKGIGFTYNDYKVRTNAQKHLDNSAEGKFYKWITEEPKQTKQNNGLLNDAEGNIFQKILGTAGDVTSDLFKGFVKGSIGIGNLASFGVAGVADMFGAKDYAKNVREANNLLLNVPDKTLKPLDDKIEKYSVSGEFLDNVFQSIGQSYASAQFGKAVGNATGLEGLNKTYQFGKFKIDVPITSVITGMSNSMNEAYKNGANNLQALTSGIIGGVSEGISEGFFSGAFGQGGSSIDDIANNWINNIANTTARRTLKTLAQATGEGLEEIISSGLEHMLGGIADGMYGIAEAVSGEDLKKGYKFQKDLSWQELGQEFFAGFLSGGLSTGGKYIGMSTGLTQNQKLQSAIENKTAQVQQAMGTTLSENQQNEIAGIVKNNQNASVEDIRTELENNQKLKSALIEEETQKLKEQKAKEMGDDILPEDVAISDKEKAQIEKQVEENIEKGTYSTNKLESLLTSEEDRTKFSELNKDINDKITKLNDIQNKIDNETDESKKQTLQNQFNRLQKELNNYRSENEEFIKNHIKNGKFIELNKYNPFYNSYVREYNENQPVRYETQNVKNDKVKAFQESINNHDIKNTESQRKSLDAYSKVIDRTNVDALVHTTEEAIQEGLIKEKTKLTSEQKQQIKSLEEQIKNETNQNKLQELKNKLFDLKYDLANGIYDGKIHIILDAKGNINQVFIHELKHSLEGTKLNTKYNELLKKIAEVKHTFSDKQNDYQYVEEQVKNNYDPEQIDNEISAYLTQTYLGNEDFIQEIAQDKSLVDKFKKVIHDLKVMFKGTQEEKDLLKLENKFNKMLDEVAKQRKNGIIYQKGEQQSIRELIESDPRKKKFKNFSNSENYFELDYDVMEEINAIVSTKAFKQVNGDKLDFAQTIESDKNTYDISADIMSDNNYYINDVSLIPNEIEEIYDETNFEKSSNNNQTNTEYDKGTRNINIEQIKESTTGGEILELFEKQNNNGITRRKSIISNRANEELNNSSFSNVQQSKPILDNQGRELTEQQQELFKDSKARDDNGQLVTVYHTTTGNTSQFNEFNPVGTSYYKFGDQVVNYYTNSKIMSGSYADGEYKMANAKKINSLIEAQDMVNQFNNENNTNISLDRTANGDFVLINKTQAEFEQKAQDILNKYSDRTNLIKDWLNNGQDIWGYYHDNYNNNPPSEYDYNLLLEVYNNENLRDNYEVRVALKNLVNGSDNKELGEVKKYNNEKDIYKNIITDLGNTINQYDNPKLQYEGYVNITNPYIIDAEGRNWNKIESKEDSVTTNKMISLDTLTKDRLIQLAQDSKNRYKNTQAEFNKWNDAINSIDGSLREENDIKLRMLNREFRNNLSLNMINEFVNNEYNEEEFEKQEKGLAKIHVYRTNSDIMYGLYNNDLISFEEYDKFTKTQNVEQSSRDRLKELINKEVKYNEYDEDGRNPIEKKDTLLNLWTKYTNSYIEKNNTGNYEYSTFDNQLLDNYLKDDLSKSGLEARDEFGVNNSVLKDLFKVSSNNFDEDYIRNEYNDWSVTNDIVKQIINLNKYGENYDGVIIKNTVDYGGYSDSHEPADLYITFNSNQFKSVENKTPTDDPDWRYSKENILPTANTPLLEQVDNTLNTKYQQLEELNNFFNQQVETPKREIPKNPTKEESYDKPKTRHEVIQEYRQQARDNLGDLSEFTDKKRGIQYQINTMKRNLRDIVNKETADKLYKNYFQTITTNNATIEKEITRYNDRISQYNLNDIESSYVQMYGESKYNPDTTLTAEQINNFYQQNRNRIDQQKCIEAVETFRQSYDELIAKMNEVLTANGYDAIPYREGYFPHFIEDKPNTLFGKIMNKLGWNIKSGTLPTDIAGITDQFKPGKVWTSFSQHRTGDATDYNALKGFDNYVRGAMNVIYHTEDIQKLRALENEIRYQYSDKGVQEQIDSIYADDSLTSDEKDERIQKLVENVKTNPLGNFATELRNYTDNIANKKAFGDRSMEQAFGRSTYSIMQNLNSRVSANMVGANIGSAITNFIPITQAWSEVSTKNMLKAIKESTFNTLKNDGFDANSVYLTNRTQQADRLYKTGIDKVNSALGIPFEAIDSFTSNTIVRAKYYDNIEKGMSETEAMTNADEFAKDVMAGRSKGDQPTIFNRTNPVVKMFTAFQLEVNNQFGFMFKDLPDDLKEEGMLKLASAFFKMFLGAWLYNELGEKITGRRAAFDPFNMAVEDYELLTNEDKNLGEKIKEIATETAKETPFLGGIMGGGRLPIQGAIPYSDPLSMITSTLDDLPIALGDDSDKKKTAINRLKKEWSKPVYYLGLPFAGGQIKKSVEGLGMYNNEVPGSYTNSGKLRFTVDDDFKSKFQSFLFGQYANDNARQYFDEGRSPLSEKQTKELMDLNIPIQDYWKYRDGIKGLTKTEDKLNYIASTNFSNEQKNIMIQNAIDRKTPINISDYMKYSNLEEFDYATKNPEKYKISQLITKDFNQYKKYQNDISELRKNTTNDKEETIEYINNLPLSFEQKIMFIKQYYKSFSYYDKEIFNYVNNQDMTIDEKRSVLKQLGYNV